MKKYIFFTALVSLIFFSLPLFASENEEAYHPEIERVAPNTPPMVIKAAKPNYPWKAKREGIEGIVIVKFILTKEGNVEDPIIVEAVPQGYFEDVAIEAILKYEFEPAMKNGKPVDCILNAPLIFSFWDTFFSFDASIGLKAYRAWDNGVALFKKEEYQKAIEEFSKAIDLRPKYSAAYFYRASSYMKIGENSIALSDLNKAIKFSSDIPAYYNQRGLLYILLENYQMAIKNFEKAIKLDKEMMEAYFNRGNAFMRSGRYQDAVEDYTKVIDSNTDDVQAYNNRGYCYSKLNDIKNTCMDFKKACELGDCMGFEALQRAGKCSDTARDAEGLDGKEKTTN